MPARHRTLGPKPTDILFALAYLDDQLECGTPGAEEQLKTAAPDLVKELFVSSAGVDAPPARFVLGLNPRRPFDDQYRVLLDLVGDQLRTGLANARAYEQERKRAEALAELDRAKTAFFSTALAKRFVTPPAATSARTRRAVGLFASRLLRNTMCCATDSVAL